MAVVGRKVKWDQDIVAEGLIFALAALLPTYLVRFTVISVPTTLWEVLLYIVTVYFLISARLRLSTVRNDANLLPISLIFIAGVGAVAISSDTRFALGQFKALIFDALLFYYLLRSVSRSPATLISVIDAYAVGAVAVSGYELWSAFIGGFTYDARVIGVFGADAGASPNYLALFVAPAAVYMILSAQKAKGVWILLRALAGLSLLSAIILSGSRAALLAAVLTIVVGLAYEISKRLSRRTRIILIGIALAFILLIGIRQVRSFQSSFARNTSDRSVISSDRSRWEIWRVTTREIIPDMSFFGADWGNFQAAFTEKTKDLPNFREYIAPYAVHPHNFFLTTLVTLGWLGLAGWIWLVIVAIRGAWKMLPTQLPLVMVFSVWLIHGLVDTTYYKNDLAPLTWLIFVPLLWSVQYYSAARQGSEKPNI